MRATKRSPGKARPRVLFLMNSLIVGGSERKSVRLANALQAAGWSVSVAYLDAAERTPAPLRGELDPGITVTCLGRRRHYSLTALYRLYRILRSGGFGTVLSVNLHPLCYLVPCLLLSKRRAPRSIALINTTEPRSRRDAVFLALYRLLLLRHVDRLVFGCRYQMARWLGQGGLRPGRATVIYNGIDHRQFGDDREFEPKRRGGSSPSLVIGTVGQLRPEKNHRELLSALWLLRRRGYSPTLVIVGDGPEGARLRQLARTLGLEDSVRFVGQQADVRPWLAVMDVFVLSSVTETFSNAALEAMASALPVVISRVGGAPEMITHGQDGLLYPSGDAEALAELLAGLIDDEEMRRRLGRNARRSVLTRFSLERMASEFQELLGEGWREPPQVAR